MTEEIIHSFCKNCKKEINGKIWCDDDSDSYFCSELCLRSYPKRRRKPK